MTLVLNRSTSSFPTLRKWVFLARKEKGERSCFPRHDLGGLAAGLKTIFRRNSDGTMPVSLLTKASPRFFPPLGTIYFALRCDGSSGESIDPSRALASFKAEHLIGDIAKSLLAGRRVFHWWKRSTMFAVFLKWCATLISWTGIYASRLRKSILNSSFHSHGILHEFGKIHKTRFITWKLLFYLIV